MRAVTSSRWLGLVLLGACLSTQDVSLGELPNEVEGDAGADAAVIIDAAFEGSDAGADAIESAEHDGEIDEPEPHADAGLQTAEHDSSVPLADAGHDAASDASADAEPPPDAARDASSTDASDGSLPAICIREPWHCW